MGVCIKIPDVTFKNDIGIAEIEETPVVPDVPDTYPVTDTLKGLYYLGGTQDESLVDHSGNGNNATALGTITYADGYATFADSGVYNRIDTPVLTSVENKTTVVALFRVPTGLRPIASNYTANDAGYVLTNKIVRIVAGGAGANHNYNTGQINSQNFALIAFTLDRNGGRVVRDVNGSNNTLVTASVTPDAWTGTHVIGGYRSNMSMNDTADIALVAIHEGDVTDEQLQQIFAYVRWYGESKGLTIA